MWDQLTLMWSVILNLIMIFAYITILTIRLLALEIT